MFINKIKYNKEYKEFSKAYNLLLVEDDQSLGPILKERLEKEKYNITLATTYNSAINQIKSQNFDLIILDIGLPDGSGQDLAKYINNTKPFIFITAKIEAQDRLKGFELGAIEYIPKPFHLKELLIRVKHVLKNHTKKNQIQLNDLTINFDSMTITNKKNQNISITTKDFLLLKLLVLNKPKVFSRDEILNLIWGEDKFPTNRTVDNSIVRLRKLINDPKGEYIKTIRSIGYKFQY